MSPIEQIANKAYQLCGEDFYVMIDRGKIKIWTDGQEGKISCSGVIDLYMENYDPEERLIKILFDLRDYIKSSLF